MNLTQWFEKYENSIKEDYSQLGFNQMRIWLRSAYEEGYLQGCREAEEKFGPKGDDPMTFDQWLSELNSLAEAEGCRNYVEQTGKECWRYSYNSGSTPLEAWNEEKSAAHSLGCL